MGIAMGPVYLAAALTLFALWLRAVERDAEAGERSHESVGAPR